MIWLIGLLLVAVIALIVVVDWHLGGIRQQLSGVGQRLNAVINRLDEVDAKLHEIERDTDQFPKVERRRFDDC